MKRLGIAIATILALLAALYWQSPLLLATAASRYAAAAGMHLEAQFARPGPGQLAIRELSVRGDGFTATIDRLSVHYELLSISRIAINRAAVEIERGDGDGAGLPDPWTLLPAERLTLASLHLTDVSSGLNLDGNLAFDRYQLDFRGEFTLPELAPMAVDAAIARLGPSRVSIRSDEDDVALKLRGARMGDQLYVLGDARVNAATMTPFFPLPDGVNGTITGPVFARLPWPPAAATLTDTIAAADVELRAQINRPGLKNFTAEGPLRLRLAAGGRATFLVQQDAHFQGVVDAGQIRGRVRAPLSGRWEDGVASVDAGSVEMDLPPIDIADQQIDVETAMVTLERLRLDGSMLTGAVSASPTSSANARIAFTADVARRSGHFEVRADHEIKQSLLPALLPGWQSEWDVIAGDLTVSVDGDFAPGATPGESWTLNASGDATLEQGQAAWGDSLARGINTTLPLTLAANRFTLEPAQIRIARVDTGIALTDVSLNIAGDTETLHITDAHARLFGGTAQVDELRFDVQRRSSRFEVALDGIQLEEVLSLGGYDVMGKGVVTGRLPVTIDNGAVSLDDGEIRSVNGGHIAYTGGLDAGDTPGLDIAMRALRDFDYGRLSADVSYAADGAMELAVELHGSSPNVEKGRPIHFNLTISENLLDLLRSLRAAEGLNRRIQEGFR